MTSSWSSESTFYTDFMCVCNSLELQFVLFHFKNIFTFFLGLAKEYLKSLKILTNSE